jgi:hypothetical protein
MQSSQLLPNPVSVPEIKRKEIEVKSCYSSLFTSGITGKTCTFTALGVYVNVGFSEFQVLLDEFLHYCTRWAPHKRTVPFSLFAFFRTVSAKNYYEIICLDTWALLPLAGCTAKECCSRVDEFFSFY